MIIDMSITLTETLITILLPKGAQSFPGYRLVHGHLAWDMTSLHYSGVVLGDQGSNIHIYEF